jgi:hypothetical protein
MDEIRRNVDMEKVPEDTQHFLYMILFDINQKNVEQLCDYADENKCDENILNYILLMIERRIEALNFERFKYAYSQLALKETEMQMDLVLSLKAFVNHLREDGNYLLK